MKEIVEFDDTAPCGLPLTHRFSDGVYLREIFMPKGMIVVGKKHKTRHLNIVISGKARVWDGEKLVEITAPYTFESNAGVRKVLYIEENMLWQTVHVTEETDVLKLEDILCEEKGTISFEELKDKMLLSDIETKLLQGISDV